MCLRNYKHNIELLYIDGTRILFNWRRMENPVATIQPLPSSSDDSAFIIMHLRHSPGRLLKKYKLNLSLWNESNPTLDWITCIINVYYYDVGDSDTLISYYINYNIIYNMSLTLFIVFVKNIFNFSYFSIT